MDINRHTDTDTSSSATFSDALTLTTSESQLYYRVFQKKTHKI